MARPTRHEKLASQQKETTSSEQQKRTTPLGVPQRFGSLRSVGKFVSAMGVLACIVAVLWFFWWTAATRSYPLWVFPAAGSGVLFGVLIIAMGQLVTCFVEIEHNTRRAAIAAESRANEAVRDDENERQ